MQFSGPDDVRENRLKHVERLTEINEMRNFASCWLYSANILAMHGPVNVKLKKKHVSTRCVFNVSRMMTQYRTLTRHTLFTDWSL